MANLFKEGSIGKAILATLAGGAIIFAAIAAPNAVQALTPLINKGHRRVNRRSLERAVKRLKNKRLIEFAVKNGKTVLQITEQGKKRLREFDFETMTLNVSTKWNGKWTVILFDIPEDKKNARDAFRRKISQIGCFPYHKSVFVHPSNCSDEIDFITELFHISRNVIHFQTESLGNQEYRPRKFFNLL